MERSTLPHLVTDSFTDRGLYLFVLKNGLFMVDTILDHRLDEPNAALFLVFQVVDVPFALNYRLIGSSI
jgi:hypothetical protein